MNWKKYPPSILHTGSDCFYQELIFERGDDKIYANIVEWTQFDRKVWELHIQIPEELSITKMPITLINFSYVELDFLKITRHAKKIIKSLIK